MFIRHGQSVANRDGWLAGHIDAPLSPLGVHQARLLQRELRTQRFSRILTSDLQRAVRTAELACTTQTHRIESYPELRERYLGDWEYKSRRWATTPERKHHLMSWETGPPNGESRLDVARRVLQFLTTLEPMPMTLMVAHGTLLSSIVGLLDRTPVDEMGWASVPNATPIYRTVSQGKWMSILHRLSHPTTPKNLS